MTYRLTGFPLKFGDLVQGAVDDDDDEDVDEKQDRQSQTVTFSEGGTSTVIIDDVDNEGTELTVSFELYLTYFTTIIIFTPRALRS